MSPALLSHGDVAKLLGVSKPTLYVLRKKDSAFPKPLDLPGLSAPKWTASQITAYLDRKIVQAREEAAEVTQ